MNQPIPAPPAQTTPPPLPWLDAYKRFLFSRHENVILKIAPLAVVGLVPIDLLDDFIPVIGVLDDIPLVIVAAAVAVRTFARVRAYRQP